MSIEAKVQAILIADGSLTALCPADRIRVPGNWQDMTRPWIIHFPVNTEPGRTHDGLDELCIWDPYQISIFGDTYGEAEDVAVAVRTALDGTHSTGVHAHFQNHYRAPSDTQTTVEHIILEFRIGAPLS